MAAYTLDVDDRVKEQFNMLLHTTGLSCNDLMTGLLQGDIPGRPLLYGFDSGSPLYLGNDLECLAIGDVLCDGIYLTDRRGIILAANKAFVKMSGIKEAQIKGGDATLLVERRLTPDPISSRVVEEKKSISLVSLINDRKIIFAANPIFDDNGQVIQILSVMRDVTELIKLQEQLEYSEKLTKQYIDQLNYLRNRELEKSGLLGNSPSIRQIRDTIYQVALVDATVLITGETGVGKEIIANEMHKNSPRREKPYIKVNCAAIPETLLESELFGYERGAFTGAGNRDKLGLFELANSGTILLDEIGEMPLNLQTKLLRAVQEKEVTRIGSTKPVKLDVRVIAATNQKLEDRVAEGKFRQDLYYRLNVIPIQVPPLRARLEDIPILANHFVQKHNQKHSTSKRIDIVAVDVMQQYNWPGNVRELANIIEQLVVIVKEPEIGPEHIMRIIDSRKLAPSYVDKSNLTLKEAVNAVERQMIQKALKICGSTHKAARVLGVSQPTVLRKARKLGLGLD